MVTIIKYKKSTTDNAIYIKVFSDITVSYLKVSTDDFLNSTNNETEFPELTRVFEEHFYMKVQVGYVLKCLNLQMFQSPLGFSVAQTDQITEPINEGFPDGKFRKVDTNFRTDSTYEKEIMNALPLTKNTLHKSEMKYHGKYGHILGRI